VAADSDEVEGERFEIEGRPLGLVLAEDGLRHPMTSRGRGFGFTRYEDVTHLASSSRSLWIGTRETVVTLRRDIFSDPDGPENLIRALLEHIAGRPAGAAQLARMAEVEETGRARGALFATWGLAIACVAGSLLQLAVGEDVQLVGLYNHALVGLGDFWRPATANLVHGFPQVPVHLVTNMLGALALGALTERSMGSARTLCVMGMAGLVAMLSCGLAGYPQVLGASGIVTGLFGAVVWLELRHATEIPAWLRIPRRLLGTIALVSVVFDIAVPITASAAHLGGFLAGVATTACVAGRPAGRLPSAGWVRGLAASLLAVFGVSVAQAGVVLATTPDYHAYSLARVLDFPDVTPIELNEYAWALAISDEPTQAQLEAARVLAQRAVDETDREIPEVLDTLAELQFQLGRSDSALATIEEAIALAPGEDYFREQRRRFLGERAAEDRPEMGETPDPREEDASQIRV
jgi:membrane associated rhomboid family serine protease